jgi:DNA-binding MarR family transcriptional regulator
MNAFPTDADDLAYSALPPVLLIGDGEQALSCVRIAIEGAGLRIGATVPVAAAHDRLQQQAAASALWVELEDEFGQPAQELLAEVSRGVGEGRYGAVVSAPSRLIDPVSASVDEARVEFIVDADDQQRAAAIAIALAGAHQPARLSDVAADKNAARLRQLSEEVNRIASTLARLSSGPAHASGPQFPTAPQQELPELSADTVRSVIRARRLRSRYFQEDLFADPAWDMLLDLLQAEIAQLRVPVSSLCIAAAVPATTALRWLKTLVDQGLFVRRADPHDGRRVFVELSPEASQALRRYFADLGKTAVI